MVNPGLMSQARRLPNDRLPAEVDPSASPQLAPEVGLVELTGARIVLPLPMLEPGLNLLLRRQSGLDVKA